MDFRHYWIAIEILFIGLILSSLTLFYFFTMAKRRRLTEEEVKTRTKQLADANALLNPEISEKEHFENDLMKKQEYLERHYRALEHLTIDGIISVTQDGSIMSWNFGAEQMFGYKEADILFKPLTQVIPNGDLFREEGSSKPIELQGRHHHGHVFPLEVSHTRWNKGQEIFDTIIVREITERKENERRLIKAMREARAANAAKSEFLAIISHELRTPLNAIIGFNQCILMGMDGEINSNQEESLMKIEKSAFHLLTLIDDILDLAKIEANKLELELLPQNIVDIIQSCVDEMTPLALKKSLTIELYLEKPFILIEIDKMRIRQVILNLLSNAIKFTQHGSITIKLLNFTHSIQFDVIDTGIGLTIEEVTKIFRPFSQANSSITRKYGGTGLGLVISKRIIELHGGQIYVVSEKGKGSTFGFNLPKNQ